VKHSQHSLLQIEQGHLYRIQHLRSKIAIERAKQIDEIDYTNADAIEQAMRSYDTMYCQCAMCPWQYCFCTTRSKTKLSYRFQEI